MRGSSSARARWAPSASDGELAISRVAAALNWHQCTSLSVCRLYRRPLRRGAREVEVFAPARRGPGFQRVAQLPLGHAGDRGAAASTAGRGAAGARAAGRGGAACTKRRPLTATRPSVAVDAARSAPARRAAAPLPPGRHRRSSACRRQAAAARGQRRIGRADDAGQSASSCAVRRRRGRGTRGGSAAAAAPTAGAGRTRIAPVRAASRAAIPAACPVVFRPPYPARVPPLAPSAVDLLAWYDRHRRRLPWRARAGRGRRSVPRLAQRDHAAADHRRRRSYPTMNASSPGFRAVAALAAAPLSRTCWPRGRGSATTHVPATCTPAPGRWRRPAGFRADLDGLRALPGIGPYTAAAVGAIAFDVPAVPVDGNVERVAAAAVRHRGAAARRQAGDAPTAAALGGDPDAARERPSDFAQALFDLGATVCTPIGAGLRGVPMGGRLCRRPAGIAAELPRQGAEAGASAAAWGAFLADRRRRPCAAAPAPAARAAWAA